MDLQEIQQYMKQLQTAQDEEQTKCVENMALSDKATKAEYKQIAEWLRWTAQMFPKYELYVW